MTRRVDLMCGKDIVLIETKGILRPFKIIENLISDKKTKGTWIITNEEDFLDSSTPCIDMSDVWIEKTINSISSKIEFGKSSIEILKSIKLNKHKNYE